MAALEMRIQLLTTNIRNHHKFSIKIVEWKNVSEIKLHQVAQKLLQKNFLMKKRKNVPKAPYQLSYAAFLIKLFAQSGAIKITFWKW